MVDRHPPFENVNCIVVVSCVYPVCDQMFAKSMIMAISFIVREQAYKAGWRWMRNPGGYSDGLVCPDHAKVLTEDQLSKISSRKPKRRKKKR